MPKESAHGCRNSYADHLKIVTVNLIKKSSMQLFSTNKSVKRSHRIQIINGWTNEQIHMLVDESGCPSEVVN